jgi:hypothetical protein
MDDIGKLYRIHSVAICLFNDSFLTENFKNRKRYTPSVLNYKKKYTLIKKNKNNNLEYDFMCFSWKLKSISWKDAKKILLVIDYGKNEREAN